MHYQPPGEKYDPCRSLGTARDDTPGTTILLLHKGRAFVPSAPMPCYDASVREVREFFVSIMLERKVPLNTAKSIAHSWSGNGLKLHIHNFQTYQCYFKDKIACVLFMDVHGIIKRESRERQRQRVALRRQAKLAKLPELFEKPLLVLAMVLITLCLFLPHDTDALIGVFRTIAIHFWGPLKQYMSLDEGTFGCSLEDNAGATRPAHHLSTTAAARKPTKPWGMLE